MKSLEEEIKKVGTKSVSSKRVNNRKRYLTRLLKKSSKYSPEMSMQVKLAAQLMVKLDNLAESTLDPDYSPTIKEISREGYERTVVNPMETIYMNCAKQVQSSLKALGMNFDSKSKPGDGDDGFQDFVNSFND